MEKYSSTALYRALDELVKDSVRAGVSRGECISALKFLARFSGSADDFRRATRVISRKGGPLMGLYRSISNMIPVSGLDNNDKLVVTSLVVDLEAGASNPVSAPIGTEPLPVIQSSEVDLIQISFIDSTYYRLPSHIVSINLDSPVSGGTKIYYDNEPEASKLLLTNIISYSLDKGATAYSEISYSLEKYPLSNTTDQIVSENTIITLKAGDALEVVQDRKSDIAEWVNRYSHRVVRIRKPSAWLAEGADTDRIREIVAEINNDKNMLLSIELSSYEPLSVDRERLKNSMSKHIRLDDAMLLCSQLGVNFEVIEGNTLSSKIHHMVEYFDRRGMISDLIDKFTGEWKTSDIAIERRKKWGHR
jgi:hypothetical protein